MQDLGLSHLWSQGDFVMRATAIILLIMSLLSWIVILTKAWDLVRLKKMAHGAEKRFWHSDDFDHALDTLGASEANPFRTLAVTGKEAAQHHRASQPQLHDALDISDWLTRSLKSSIDEAVARMQSGLAILASVGSTAPFVGLFGTVWGIYHALIGIGASGVPTIDKVAGPVGEALIMTAFGLAVAIPAVLGYNALSRGNKGVISKLNRFAHDLHAYFVTGARVRPTSAARATDDASMRLAVKN
ncbi:MULTISPECIES: MotA/TolQ/ExbB proton channel family protein [Cupriavidus]|uniref:Biopolymer transport protein ExbB n=1 Tax=Cupriavidus pauculus TaxID=82633 RepID=A0A3G8H146_9BURK|nr:MULTISPECIES: MotA/TolQ/ExbB proton channel family protein [Cupriavidus]AZG13995.1 MotA/TolQ/ExbB proton channel family protein [Cupriavidus pauculus]MDT6959985.1 MotA/TolQ/ExbB proton channel family protein [Cupriavidus sp. SZY C1]